MRGIVTGRPVVVLGLIVGVVAGLIVGVVAG